ncbi:MAG: hypothetical protein U5K72_13110 [Balneolaceae bacterium]|nr:hypothetical protein [Balneolaceae bacterium]
MYPIKTNVIFATPPTGLLPHITWMGTSIFWMISKRIFSKRKSPQNFESFLHIAKKVQILGNKVTDEDIKAAKEEGATDREIHDTVLITAAFCMYNRYVDGLGTWAPEEKEAYNETGKMLANEGYIDSI